MAADLVCAHRFCGRPILHGYARFRFVAGHEDLQPFHAACSYAHPDYDVSLGLGAPFTEIVMADL